jgi:tetratricopeptide (TPR) repeat protein
VKPGFVQGFNDRGTVYFQKREYDRAIRDYDEALRLDAIRWLGSTGAAPQSQGRCPTGIQDFDEVLARANLCPGFLWPGLCLSAQRRFRTAIRFDQVISST